MTLRPAVLALAASFLVTAPLLAQKPGGKVDTILTSDSKETMAERVVFPPTQPKIYVFYMMADATKGQKVKAVWVAEQVEGMKKNEVFSEVETSSAGGTYWGSFSYPKPKDAPWPVGSYRVDILIDGSVASNTKFKIQK